MFLNIPRRNLRTDRIHSRRYKSQTGNTHSITDPVRLPFLIFSRCVLSCLTLTLSRSHVDSSRYSHRLTVLPATCLCLPCAPGLDLRSRLQWESERPLRCISLISLTSHFLLSLNLSDLTTHHVFSLEDTNRPPSRFSFWLKISI